MRLCLECRARTKCGPSFTRRRERAVLTMIDYGTGPGLKAGRLIALPS
jgi:hypothetical protein